jgi:D-amino-acid dehydrogenase
LEPAENDVKIAVLGAGVIGVTSAWYLARQGHEVEVIERGPAPALGASHANAGQISWSYATPWAAPGIPLKALRWLFSADSPLIIHPRLDPGMWRFLAAMLLECNSARYDRNKHELLRLGAFSIRCLSELLEEAPVSFDHGARGLLQIFRDERDLGEAWRNMPVLEKLGIPHELLSSGECLDVEPGLSVSSERFAGGLHLPGDHTGDCRKFTAALAERAAALGVKFRYGESVTSIKPSGAQVECLLTSVGSIRADAYVLALGNRSAELMRTAGIRIPVYPVKGHSVTLPIVDVERAPRSTVMDEANKVAITRLGHRIRVGGFAEFAGQDPVFSRKRSLHLLRILEELFPGAGDLAQMSQWAGLRAMTPTGLPLVGRTALENLFINTGHGTLGWTLACGTAQTLAETIGDPVNLRWAA